MSGYLKPHTDKQFIKMILTRELGSCTRGYQQFILAEVIIDQNTPKACHFSKKDEDVNSTPR